ncbi:unnamed protein product [Closterium sp. Naga37s-1]|nr:unnamed protein product [Closterium sp. Naga37s-1]
MPHLYSAACPSPPPSQLFACAAAVAVGGRGRTGRDWRPNRRASQLAPRPSPIRHPHLHDPSLPRLHLPRQQLPFRPVPALSLPLPVPPSSRLPPLPRLPMPCWAVVGVEDSGGGGGGNGGSCGSGGIGGSCGGVGEAWGKGVVGGSCPVPMPVLSARVPCASARALPVLFVPVRAPPVPPVLSVPVLPRSARATSCSCAAPVFPCCPRVPMLPPCCPVQPLCCPVLPVLPRCPRVAPFCPCCLVQPVSCPVLPVLACSARAAPFCPFVSYPCCPYPLVPHPCCQFSLVPHPVCAARSRAARHPRAARPVQHLVATRTRYPYPCSSHTVHQLRGVQPQPGTCSTAVVQMLLGGCCLSASEGAPCWCSHAL